MKHLNKLLAVIAFLSFSSLSLMGQAEERIDLAPAGFHHYRTSLAEIGVSVETIDFNTFPIPGIEARLYDTDDSLLAVTGPPLFFESLELGQDYTVDLHADEDHLNGVSTFDMVLINKHILGVQPLSSPYHMIAADVNNSGSITISDLIVLRRLILSHIDYFPSNTSWRFVDPAYTFPGPTNPWLEPFPERITTEARTHPSIPISFVGIKIGDINGDAQGFSTIDDRSQGQPFVLEVTGQQARAGQLITAEFAAADLAALGYQGTLSFNEQALEWLELLPGLANGANFNFARADEGLIAMSWNGELQAERTLFSLVFRAKQEGLLSNWLSIDNRMVRAEAYRDNGQHTELKLRFNAHQEGALTADFELHQNAPNPFREETVIGFYLPAAGRATLKISDLSGRLLQVVHQEAAQGYNQFLIDSKDLPASGLLIYSVETTQFAASRKMLLLNGQGW